LKPFCKRCKALSTADDTPLQMVESEIVCF